MGNKSSAPPPAPSAEDGEAPQFVIHEHVRVRSARRPRTRCVLVVALCCSTVINTVEPEPDTSQAGQCAHSAIGPGVKSNEINHHLLKYFTNYL